MSLLRWMTIAASGALLSLATACGSDDDGDEGSGGSGGTTGGSGGTGGSTAGAGGSDGGSGGTAGGTGGTAGGSGGSGGSGGATGAAAFCAEYETTCGFGTDRYADMAECESMYESFSSERQGCVETHVGLAGGDANLHCPHATGEAPCN